MACCGYLGDIPPVITSNTMVGFTAGSGTGRQGVHRPFRAIGMFKNRIGQNLKVHRLVTQSANASLHDGHQTDRLVKHGQISQHVVADILDRGAAGFHHLILGLYIAADRARKVIGRIRIISVQNVRLIGKQALQPCQGRGHLLIRMCADLDNLLRLLAARRTAVMDHALFHTGRCKHFLNLILMSLTRQDLGILFPAVLAGIQHASVGIAGCGSFSFLVAMSRCGHEIRTNPLAAHRANRLITALFGTGGRCPYGIHEGMSSADMGTVKHKFVVSAHGHTRSITDPALLDIALLWCDLGSDDLAAVRQPHLGKQRCAVLSVEAHGIDGQTGLQNRICIQILGRGGGNAVSHTVTVQIPSDQHLGILLSFFDLQFRLTNDLRGQIDLIAVKLSVFIIEIGNDPFIAVDYTVTVVPGRVVCIPAQIHFQSVHVDRHAGKIGKRLALHGHSLVEDHGFQRHGNRTAP